MMISSAKTLTVRSENPHFTPGASFWIHTASSPQIGFGHLRRCMTLAEALRDCCEPLFLLNPEDHWSKMHLQDHGFDSFSDGFDSAWARVNIPRAILLDTRLTEGLESLLAGAKSRKLPVISIHDLGLNPLPSDIVVDGSVAPNFDIERPGSVYLLGTNYMILDPDYCSLNRRRKRIRKEIRSIFVNLGGGDAHKHFPRVLEGLKLWSRELQVVAAPGFVSWGQEQLAQRDWHPLHFRWESSSIVESLFQADLAITAGGLSAYEALCTGTPLLAMSYDPLQQTAISAIAAAGACIDLGPADELEPVHLATVLSMIDAVRNERKPLSMNGRKMVDGRGAERVSRIIRRLIQKHADSDSQRSIA